MLDIGQFQTLVIQPALKFIGLDSEAARQLLIGTAVQESRLTYLRQLEQGPALGVYQMEPDTIRDIWDNFLVYRPELADKVKALQISDGIEEVTGNLFYATALARIHYYRVPERLPAVDDIAGQAMYWKKYYNTFEGKGTSTEYLSNWYRFVQP